MPTTTVRGIDLILTGSLGKETLSNDAFQNLALGISGPITLALSSTDVTLTTGPTGQAMRMIHILTGTLTANINVIVPAEGRVFVVDNRTTGAWTVSYKTATGAGLAVTQGQRQWIYGDGVDVWPIGAAGGGGGGGGDTMTGEWQWTTATSGAPASGQIGVTGAVYASATEVRVAHLSNNGTDFATFLGTLKAQDEVRIQDQSNSTLYIHYRLTGPRTSQGTWSTLPVTWLVGNGTLSNNAIMVVSYQRVVVVAPAAPVDASYLVSSAHSLLTGERVVTDTPTVTWDHATAGQAKAQVPAGAVTYATLQDVSATPRLLGRYSAGAGDAQEVSLGAGLSLDTGGILSATAAGQAPGGLDGQAQFKSGTAFAGSSGLTLNATKVVSLDLVSPLPLLEGGTGGADAATARTNLGVAIGTNVQAADATLSALAGVTTGANTLPYFTGVDLATTTPLTAFARTVLDDGDAATARATLAIPPLPEAATETVAGIVELATQAEVTTGVDVLRAVTPATLQVKMNASASPAASETVAGIVELATQAEVTTGIDVLRVVTPATLQVKLNAVLPGAASESVVGLTRYGTPTETTTGTLTTVATHPAGVKAALDAKVPAGTPLSVSRYAASGTALEASTATLDGTGTLTVTGALSVGDAPTTRTNLDLGTTSAVRLARLGLGVAADSTIPLVLNPVVGQKLLLYGTNATTRNGFAVESAQLQIFCQSNARLHLGAMSTSDGTTFTPHLSLVGATGLVGVGTIASATLGSGASYQALSVKGSTLYVGQSSVQERALALVQSAFVVSTDSTRTARLTLSAYDATAAREGLRLEADGTAARLSFFGANAVAKPTVTGARGGNAALSSLLTALSSLGLVVDSSTA